MWKLASALCAALMMTAAMPAQALDYPARPLRLVVGYAAGGSTDVLARLTASKLSELIGQQVVVENKPGANGNIAGESVARARPDGYTLFIGGAASAINASLYRRLSFSFAKDFAPVGMIGSTPSVMVVPMALPVKTPGEFVAYAKANPGKVNFASSGTGATTHLSGELFKLQTGIEMTHVPYKGSAPALADLVAGRVEVMFDNLISATPHIQSGQLRPLGLTGPVRRPSMPDVPTLKEQGFDVVVLSWAGIYVPAETPPEIIAYLNAQMRKVAAMPDYREKLSSLGVEPQVMGVDEMKSYTRAEIAKFARVVEASGARAD
ncbi:tripartite tricarboxylate transporter substrate binding protein [Vineibacter terrae]|uniref:Bug family tripartite tricarboxylate transporter substrate binding protein n=1 Tax=Vineibacter terrae TaxID=2586908 RepID=UPI002E342BAB|nr:tripartite tricarboxylate transporter substrate binding protein [Vineibacter terrae]HEX2891478.1 tripartite tricarboxylate transporter substrate binding protein [Vineibacter terrae]